MSNNVRNGERGGFAVSYNDVPEICRIGRVEGVTIMFSEPSTKGRNGGEKGLPRAAVTCQKIEGMEDKI